MSFIHNLTCECTKAELDHFGLLPTPTSIEQGEWKRYKPMASISSDAPLEFHVTGSSEEYTDVSKTRGSDRRYQAVPVNNFMHSMFSEVGVYLNQKLITSNTNLYLYRAYMHMLLNYNESAKSTQCQCALWYPDTAGQFDTLGATNAGYASKTALTEKSIVVQMMYRLVSDIFLQQRYIPNGVDIVIKLSPAKPSFCLMSATADVRFTILDATLNCRKVKLNPSVLLGHTSALQKQDKTVSSPYLGQIPVRIIVFFVSNTALNENGKHNPSNFNHFDLCELSLHVDGRQIPSAPLQPNHEDGQYIEAYLSTFTGTGLMFKDDGHCISRAAYPNGYCLYAFNLTSHLSANDCHWTLRKSGAVNIEVRFKKALPQAVNLVTFAEFQNLIQIDKQRNVSTDF
ncbi:hypothetical protein B566_EDAN017147 [Ephemera danica]|nr:hypothetical protein B566_EDAN017147 [Ephemera danica]